MKQKPFRCRVELIAEKMLFWIKEEEPGTRYTFNGLRDQFLQENFSFQKAEVEAAIRSLLSKALVHFDKRSLVTTGKSPQAT